MNNELVAWMQTLIDGHTGEVKHTLEFIRVGINDIPLYTHPAKTLKDREADRKRFSDEGFNRWLDESISDSGHTVYDLVENVCEAWHGWENSQYYRPAKTLTDEEIWEVINRTAWVGTEEEIRFKIAEAILRKAQTRMNEFLAIPPTILKPSSLLTVKTKTSNKNEDKKEQIKDLTDEEIKSCWDFYTDCPKRAIDFARAILRKANEK